MLSECGRGRPDVIVAVTEPDCRPHHSHVTYGWMLHSPDQVIVLYLGIAEHGLHIVDRSIGKTDSLQYDMINNYNRNIKYTFSINFCTIVLTTECPKNGELAQ